MKFNPRVNQIQILDENTSAVDVMKTIAKSDAQEDAFYVFDIDDLVRKHREWQRLLPRVFPYYAVKCNDHHLLLKILSAMGLGFDCASKGEISKVMNMGVEASRIIFANPTKSASHIRYAASAGVDVMTFDNENELYKVKAIYPSAKLILRIRCDASKSLSFLGLKFGCDANTEAPKLLQLAKSLGLEVMGVSFHVGSGCGEPESYYRAIEAANRVFDVARTLGFEMRVLDIGGGYPGEKDNALDKFAEIINKGLDYYFPASRGVNIIAEPGRYYTESAFTLMTNVHSKKEAYDLQSGQLVCNMYYINDGIYGSFNSILSGNMVPVPTPLSKSHSTVSRVCTIYGPTCDGIDVVSKDAVLPILEVGDWIMWENMGAYTITCSSSFNGFTIPKVYMVTNEDTMSYLGALLGISLDDLKVADISDIFHMDSYQMNQSQSFNGISSLVTDRRRKFSAPTCLQRSRASNGFKVFDRYTIVAHVKNEK